MANRRMINKFDMEMPGWQRLTIVQRYIYWGAMLLADNDGVLPVFLLERQICDTQPLDDKDLDSLKKEGLIHVYKDGVGDKYIQIQKWWDKQFLDKKIYKPTQYPTSEYHLIRPENLKKTKMEPSFYEPSGKPLEQYKKEKGNSVKDKIDETSLAEKKKEDTKDENLPFS